jgi:hypothetical protein
MHAVCQAHQNLWFNYPTIWRVVPLIPLSFNFSDTDDCLKVCSLHKIHVGHCPLHEVYFIYTSIIHQTTANAQHNIHIILQYWPLRSISSPCLRSTLWYHGCCVSPTLEVLRDPAAEMSQGPHTHTHKFGCYNVKPKRTTGENYWWASPNYVEIYSHQNVIKSGLHVMWSITHINFNAFLCATFCWSGTVLKQLQLTIKAKEGLRKYQSTNQSPSLWECTAQLVLTARLLWQFLVLWCGWQGALIALERDWSLIHWWWWLVTGCRKCHSLLHFRRWRPL